MKRTVFSSSLAACAAHLDASSMLMPPTGRGMSGANASAIARSHKETARRERNEREPDRAKQSINGAPGEGRSNGKS